MRNKKIVAFHIGRGGRYYNAGHLSYIGEYEISHFINDLFIQENGEYFDGSENSVGLTEKEVETGIGRIDVDGLYDTTYCKFLDECNEEELELIAKD